MSLCFGEISAFVAFICCRHFVVTGQACTCHPNAVTEIVYDSSFRQPICRSTNCTTNAPNCTAKSAPPTRCPLFHLRESINLAQPSKCIQIIETASAPRSDNVSRTTKCDRSVAACDEPKNYERFGDYCIPQTLLKDYQSYRQFKVPLPIVIDIYANLDFLVFFCQTLRLSGYCEHIANLCVLSK